MNSTLCVQPEVHTLSPCVLGKCKCKSLEDLWRGGRHACDAVKVLAKKFLMSITSREAYDEEMVACLESLFLKLSFNWIRLDSQLRCFKEGLCQCTRLTGVDVLKYFQYVEEAWDEFYFCSELLINARIKTGRATPLEGVEFLWDLAHLKKFN